MKVESCTGHRPGRSLCRTSLCFVGWPTRRQNMRLVVNVSGRTPGLLVATYFMTNGVPVSYNLAIHGAYIESRHGNEYNNEVARLLRRWAGDLTYARG